MRTIQTYRYNNRWSNFKIERIRLKLFYKKVNASVAAYLDQILERCLDEKKDAQIANQRMREDAMTDPWQSRSSRSHMAGRLLFNLGDAVDQSVHAAARPLQERRLFDCVRSCLKEIAG